MRSIAVANDRRVPSRLWWTQCAAVMLVTSLAVPVAAQIEKISNGIGGQQANGRSELPATNGDGSVIVFKSLASNLIAADNNGKIDVFLFDRVTGVIERVPIRPDTQSDPQEESFPPVVSDDGRFVAFGSAARNLVRGDFNLFPDAYRYDRADGSMLNLSLVIDSNNEGLLGGRVPDLPASISADGRFVAFTSASAHLAGVDANETHDVFVYDTNSATIELITSTSLGTTSERAANALSGAGVISPEGRYVVFCSEATNLTVGSPRDVANIFRRDRETRTTQQIASLAKGNCLQREYMVSVSEDARVVAFVTSLGIDGGDTNQLLDVYVWYADDDRIELVSRATTGAAGNGSSAFPGISRDGRFVTFQSTANNLTDVPDTNNKADIFVADLWDGRIARLTGLGGEHIVGDSLAPAISRDGTVVVFQSDAAFTSADTNGLADIFAVVNNLSFTPTPTDTPLPTATPTVTATAMSTATLVPSATAVASATTVATATAVASATAVMTATPGNGGGTATPTNGSSGATPTAVASATNGSVGTPTGTPNLRKSDGDGCGCRIDPETGKAASSLPLLALIGPLLLIGARRGFGAREF